MKLMFSFVDSRPKRRVYPVLLGLSISFSATAADKLPSEAATITAIYENDLFGGHDNQYTNGMQVGLLSPDLAHYAEEKRLPRWLLPIVVRLPFINVPNSQHNIGVVVGQQTYTPKDTQTRDLIVDDRPYAGWLYGGLAFISKNEISLDTLEFQIGVVGPASQAEEAQKFVHDLRDIPAPKGWDNQLENEPGVALVYARKHRLLRSTNPTGWGYDVIAHGGGVLGNVYTYLNTGGEVRFGWNVPGDYGTSIIRPGGDTNAPTSVNDPRLASHRKFGIYVFSSLSGRLVLRDIFLDGNTFQDSHSVDKKYVVGDVVAGLSIATGGWKFSYAQAWRSREFDGQDRIHNFGSISASYTF
jgi:lipid A 3-O-deacylase